MAALTASAASSTRSATSVGPETITNMARRNLDRHRVHPLRELPLGIRGNRPVVPRDQVPGRQRLPGWRAHHLVQGGQRDRLLRGVHHARPGRVDVSREVVDEVVLREPAEAARVVEHVCKRRRGRAGREERAERLALVEAEGGDVDEPHDVRGLFAERGHDLPAVGVAGDDGGPVLELEHLAESRDVIRKRGERKLGRAHLEAFGLQAFDHAAPAGPVGPGSVDEDDVGAIAHCGDSFRSTNRRTRR